ncbi:MAG: hypothetical protein HYX27_23070 [Acidobacteria bacterium]|nr:hypothetical protein [Acidobacteriota bacterium]
MTRRVLFCAFPISVLIAQGKGKGKGKGKGHGGEDQPSSTSASFYFSESDRGVIASWCRRQTAANLPPGLAKRGGALPPGLEKQLRRNGRLPPGLERGTWSPFPPDLITVLPALPPQYERGFIGGQAAIVFKNTRIVVDIFKPL